MCSVTLVYLYTSRFRNEHIARLANQEDGCKGRFWPLLHIHHAPTALGLPVHRDCRYKSQPLLDEKVFSLVIPEPGKDTTRTTPHIIGFSGDESISRSENTPPFFRFDHYIVLVDWTGRAIREDKRGSTPQYLEPMFERLNMNSDVWLEAVKSAGHRFGLANNG